jgi:hypothetical protein
MALATRHPDGGLGVVDETWWSRLAQPAMQAWTAESSMRLLEHVLPTGAREPKAWCGDGLWRRDSHPLLRRFVQGRPVSHVTTDCLPGLVPRMAAERKRVFGLIWDHASWHSSREGRTGVRAHNQRVKREGGVRLLTCRLPVKSPWLHPLAPRWIHGKRAMVEPTRPLTAAEIMSRVCDDCAVEPMAPLQQHVA